MLGERCLVRWEAGDKVQTRPWGCAKVGMCAWHCSAMQWLEQQKECVTAGLVLQDVL
jgi:hypothetical protein